MFTKKSFRGRFSYDAGGDAGWEVLITAAIFANLGIVATGFAGAALDG